jgi:hypothetical protein
MPPRSKTDAGSPLTVAFVLAGGSALAVMNRLASPVAIRSAPEPELTLRSGRRDAHRLRLEGLAIGADDLDARGRSLMCHQRSRPSLGGESGGRSPGFI